jgi:hypothetical protein
MKTLGEPEPTTQWGAWQSAFDGVPPLGYLLRPRFEDRWVRLWSLPGGKRYPSTPAELSEVLTRANDVASAVLGLGAPVTAWIAHDGDRKPQVDMRAWTSAPEPPAWRADADDLEDLDGLRFLHRTFSWMPGALDEELKLCADDRLAALTVFSAALGHACCPYDGGIDVFGRSPALVQSIRTLFPAWISTHPAGL